MKKTFPILGVLTAILLSYALYEALVAAPTEQTMGDVQRIFYYHVPSAWTAFILFFVNFAASAVYLIWRKPAADIVALVSAEVGVVFCTVVLVTGPIWARPVWGIWWTWDMRLTSTLVLWLIYVSYLFLRRFSSSGQTPTLAAALAHGKAVMQHRLALAGGRPCSFGRAVRAVCLLLDLVLPHPAPAAGHGRRRID